MSAVYVFAFNLPTEQEEHKLLTGVDFVPCVGRYKGKDERSYIISAETYQLIESDLLELLSVQVPCLGSRIIYLCAFDRCMLYRGEVECQMKSLKVCVSPVSTS